MTSRSKLVSGPEVLAKPAFFLGLAISSTLVAGPVFQGVGDLPGGSTFSRVRAVSGDGLVAVGVSRSASGLEAFRWTASGGIVGLGDLPGGDFRSEALDVSADGSVIVERSRSAQASIGEAFRWQGGVMEGLGDFDGGAFRSGARAVSADGTIVAGGGNHATGAEAFIWSRQNGLVALGDLPGGAIASNAWAISASGAVVVGSSATGNFDGEAFRWTNETGMEGLGFLDGGGNVSTATAVSSDGTVIVGGSDALGGSQAYRWTELSGMISLGELFGPLALSDDASIIVGSFGQQAQIWSEGSGLRNLQELLESDYSLDLTGWTLEVATDISADGRTIVGFGTNPQGFTEGWIAIVPEPSTLALLAAGMCLVGRRRQQLL